MTDRSEAGLFRFDGFDLDASSGDLRMGETRLALQPQPFKVLALLVVRAGEVVPREEIRRQLWSAGTFVDFEGGLNFCIRQIRKALGEDARKPRYIETLHRRGYRLISQVKRIDHVPRNPFDAATSSSPRFLSSFSERPITLAVLPFHDLSCPTGPTCLADGITELLASYLSTNRSLRVVSRTTTMRYKNTDRSLPRIAKELRVERLLEGAVSYSGRRVRVTVRLIDTSIDQSEWAACYVTEMRDCLETQGQIAWAVSRDAAVHLTLKMTLKLKEPTILYQPVAVQSHEAYVQGLHHLNRRTEKDLNKAIECFDRTIGDAPDEALAHAGLAEAYVLTYCHCGPRKPWEMCARAKASAHRALQLDDALADAHATLAYCSMLSDWKWDIAERGFRTAIELNPHCVIAHQWYADLLTAVGRHDEAIEQIQLASQLDPHSIQISADVGWVLLYANRHDQAIEQYKRVLEMDGDFFLAHWGLGLAYAQVDMFSEAINSVEEAIRVTERTPTMLAALAHVLASSGRKRSALQVLSELRELATRRYVSAYDMATIAWALSNSGEAISCLERACSERSPYLAYLQVDSRFKKLRAWPPSQGVMRRIGFARA